MRHHAVPWVGLMALVAMFVIPHLPTWLLEGPRTVRHWPRRHLCGICGAPWSSWHDCRDEGGDGKLRLRGKLRRVEPRIALERPAAHASPPQRVPASEETPR